MIEIKLNDELKKRGKTMYWLSEQTGMAKSTLYRLKKSTKISYSVINLICRTLDCQPGDFLKYVSDESNETEGKE